MLPDEELLTKRPMASLKVAENRTPAQQIGDGGASTQQDVDASLDSDPPNEQINESKIYALTRCTNAAGNPGWRVLIVRRGQQFARMFTDVRFGGTESAKAAALAWRDVIVRQHPVMSARERLALRRSNSKSGIPGVRFEEYSYRPARWVASCLFPDGQTKTKCFNVSVHGPQKAYELAVAARLAMLQQIDAHELPLHVQEPVSRSVPPSVFDELVAPNAREQFLAIKTVSDSPMPGLYRWVRKRQCEGKTVDRPMWVAQLDQAGQSPVRRYFSVDQYGEEDARRLAFEQHLRWQNGEPAVHDKRGPVSPVQRVIEQGRLGERAVWQVTYRLPNGPTGGRKLQKTFAEGRYGAEQAQAMAERQRLLWLHAAGSDIRALPEVERPEPAAAQEPRFLVSRIVSKTKAAHGQLELKPFWQALYRWPDGTTRVARFTVAVYGEEQAQAKANAQIKSWELNPPQRR